MKNKIKKRHFYVPFFLICQIVLVHCAFDPPQSLQKKTGIAIVAGDAAKDSRFFCNRQQAAVIENAIKWMNRYSESAYSFLLDDDSRTSAAFIGWLGDRNIERSTSIRTEILHPIYRLSSQTRPYASALAELEDTVVIGCGTPEIASPCREPETIAFARSRSSTVVVCPVAFSNNGYFGTDAAEQATMSAWRTRRTYSPSAGLSLLHEMTHLKDVVGGFGDWPPKYGRSVDVTYAPSKCIALSSSKKIANAQNYMLFALEVKANLENASKKVAAGVPNKWQDATRLLRAGVGGRAEAP
ncbi:Neutral protease 2 [Colletotrichum higginsianum IMI 349063]|uniref:Neutral protease 2 n=2 Tax=Colletotrichum higginsianum TaxID=80884 RepID=A0A1B7Y089_COLHI|nr:Neutral protease 2 [Colletotrichum higginsianum IMI 349063]OBR05427.1 Neutral protease 2 [Colletotrichum higginsianum IMI 349063]TIC93489.1 hypothetical protein CH35J_009793 [Colletotrichum higginsianum]